MLISMAQNNFSLNINYFNVLFYFFFYNFYVKDSQLRIWSLKSVLYLTLMEFICVK